MRLRRPLVSAAILIAMGLAAPLHAEGQTAQPGASSAPNEAQGENRKSSGTNDQAGPSSAKPSPDQDAQGDKATHSVSGRGGKEEPGSHAPTQAQGEQPTPALVNGAWNVPGAPADSQTVPAKFSKRNDAIDKMPIMAMAAMAFSDEQKRKIVDSVRAANVPVQATSAKPAEELPINVTVHDLPASASDPAMAKLKYVRAADRVLLVEPSNRIVIGEIKN
jgi:hypothetical protein